MLPPQSDAMGSIAEPHTIDSPATNPRRAPRLGFSRMLQALRSPGRVWPLLHAQLSMRRCNTLPWSVRLSGRVKLVNYVRIELGHRVRVDGGTVPVELVSIGGPITIGDGTFINYGATISAHSGVSIGRDVLIGNYAMIMDSDYHDLHDRTKPGLTAPIVLEDDCWIGARAIVLKGVRVGRGAVVAAGSVVTKDVPPRTLVAGMPAQVVRTL